MFILLAVLLCGTYASAQDEYKQKGTAIQTFESDRLAAVHPSERIGSKITLVNLDTGKEVEVIVRSRPRSPLEPGVIVDLSPDAWQELAVQSGTQIGLKDRAAPVVAAVVDPEPLPPLEPVYLPEYEPPPEPVYQPEPPPPPPLAPEPPPPPPPQQEPPPPAPAPAPQPAQPAPQPMWPLMWYYPPPVWWYAPPSPAPVPPPPAPVQPPPAAMIEVIPHYPDPNSFRFFHLQVAAYSSYDTAMRFAITVQNAGFNVALERYSTVFRVVVLNVPASEVYSAIQRLGRLGIKQVWVRE